MGYLQCSTARILLLLLCLSASALSSGCNKKKGDATSSYNSAEWAACNDHLTPDYVKPGASVIIPYYINSVMLDPTTGAEVCTPRAVREKIKRVFDLYAAIPETGFAFHYAGPDPINYSATGASVANASAGDGGIHVILTDNSSGYSGIAGTNWYWGKANTGFNTAAATDYGPHPGGYVSLVLHDTAGHVSPGATSFGLMLHEIGHSLGLDHLPLKGANMSRYGGYAGEFYAMTEQERANLAGIMPAAGKTVYRITGAITALTAFCGNSNAANVLNGVADVYAVDVTNGRTYSGLVNCGSGKFWINLLRAGSYRLVVTPNGYPNLGFDTTAYQASWYVNNTTSTNDPLAGTVLTLNDSTPTVTGLTLNVINSPSAYLLYPGSATSNVANNAQTPPLNPNFMAPGESATIDFAVSCQSASGANAGVGHCDPITSLEPYGTAPDYSYSNLTLTSTFGSGANSVAFYSFKVTVNANATPGNRFLIGRAASGVVQVANFGVNILNGTKKPVKINQTYDYNQQIQGLRDYSDLDPLWWL